MARREHEGDGELSRGGPKNTLADAVSKVSPSVRAKFQQIAEQGKLNVQFFPTKNTIAHKSILDNQMPSLRYLLTFRKLKINVQNRDGDSILHLAIRSKSAKDSEIKEIVATGAKMNLRNNAGLTPFVELFLQHRSADVITYCWKRGGKIKSEDKRGRNVLYLLLEQLGTKDAAHDAALFSYFQIILEPLEVESNLQLIITRGEKERGMKWMRTFKKDYCIELNHQDAAGDTLMHVLAKKNDLNFFNAVLRFPGMDMSLANSQGKLALDYLASRSPIKELLINYHRLWAKGADEGSGAPSASADPKGAKGSRSSRTGRQRHSTFVGVEDVVDDHVNINYDYSLESKKTFVFAKGKVYEELIKTEAAYCRDITFLYHYYFQDLVVWKKNLEVFIDKYYWRQDPTIREVKEITDTRIFQIVNSVELIKKVNGELLSQLKSQLHGHPIFTMPDDVEGRILTLFTSEGTFGRLMEYYQFYSSIMRSKFEIESESRYLKEYFHARDRRYGLLDSYLIKPIQRLPRYILMLREVIKTYNRFEVANDNLRLVEKAKEYVASVCEKINRRKLQARQAKHALVLSQYFRDQFGVEILAGGKVSYVFHDMDLPVLDSEPFRVRKIKFFVFSTVIYMAYQEIAGVMGSMKKKETLLRFSETDPSKMLMKITDDNHFSIKIMDAANQIIAYFLLKYKNAFSLVYLFKANFTLAKNASKFQLFHLEERQQDELFRFQSIVI